MVPTTMPKYHKRRGNYTPYSAPQMFPQMGLYGMPPSIAPPLLAPSMVQPMIPSPMVPSSLGYPPFMRKQIANATIRPISDSSSPSSMTATHPVPPAPAHKRANLPFFEEELLKTQEREPTDVIIIDLDRTLLGFPMISRDLLCKESKQVLDYRLGNGCCWWQSRAVLEASLAENKWNPEVLSIAQDASQTDSVVLVITTVRPTSEIDLIRSALAKQGVERIDHFACTELDGGQDDEDNVTVSESAKHVMLELLLESYEMLERVVVFDGHQSNCNKYKRAVSRFVRDGWLNAEAFYVADIAGFPVDINLAAQRELIQKVLEQANNSVEKSVVIVEWLHKLGGSSREALSTALIAATSEDIIDKLIMDDICIIKGKLPTDMRALMTERGNRWQWTIQGFEIVKKSLLLEIRLINSHDEQTEKIEVARLSSNFYQQHLQHTAQQTTQPPQPLTIQDLPGLSLLLGMQLETFIYEHRKLCIQKKRT